MNTFPHPLTREFIPCTRIVAQSNAAGAEHIVNCRILRGFLANDYPVCRIEKGGFVLFDFGTELSGGVRLVTSGTMKPCKIRIRFGESCSEAMNTPNPDHALHDTELTVPAYCSMDFGSTGFRFVRIDAAEGTLELHNLLGVCERMVYEQLGTFRSSDPLLNQIFDTCVHTTELVMQEYVYDGVKRDRLVWGGDLNPEAMAILRLYGDVPVLRDTLELLGSHTPQGKFINSFSSYTLWYIITLYDHFFHSGNDVLLKAHQHYLEFEAQRFCTLVDENGAEQLPQRRFLDWPSDNSPEIIHAGLQALLVIALNDLQKMLSHLHSAVVIPEEILNRAKRHVPDPQKSKAAAALQMLAQIADWNEVLEHEPYSGVSTYLGYYLLLAKQPQNALDLVRKYWGGMLALGATTFWEDFNLAWMPNATRIDELPVPGRPDIHKDFGDFCYRGLRHSLCHGWAAGPAAWCSQKILGIEPLEPGFRTIAFAPSLCDLEFAEGTIPTPCGTIGVSLKKGCEPELKLPAGVNIGSQP